MKCKHDPYWRGCLGLDSVTESDAMSPPAYNRESVSKTGVMTMEKMPKWLDSTCELMGLVIGNVLAAAFLALIVWAFWQNFDGKWNLPHVSWLNVWCGMVVYDIVSRCESRVIRRLEDAGDDTDG